MSLSARRLPAEPLDAGICDSKACPDRGPRKTGIVGDNKTKNLNRFAYPLDCGVYLGRIGVKPYASDGTLPYQ